MCCNGGGGGGGDGGCGGGSGGLAFLETKLVYFIFILFFPRFYTCYHTLLGFFFDKPLTQIRPAVFCVASAEAIFLFCRLPVRALHSRCLPIRRRQSRRPFQN